MHRNSVLLFNKYCRKYFDSGKSILEVGPDKFPSTFNLQSISYSSWHTIDIYESESLTFTATNENSFPIPDNTYDIVLSANVIEHSRKPWLWIKELSRVCKIGGL